MSARVLVVDDLLPNVKLLEARLTAEYFNVSTAFSGVEALEFCQASPPDIILLDVMMPGMDGFEVCRRLKADPKTRHVPVVMVTALSDSEDRVRGLEAGADDFLTKPVNETALQARIRSLIRLKMMMDEWLLRQRTGQRFGMAGNDQAPVDDYRQGRVLLVDDNPLNARRLEEALQADGHKIDAAATGAEAVAIAADNVFELIVVSLNLDHEDGLRICADLRSVDHLRQVPILSVIDDGDFKRLAKALDLGVSDYLLAPYDRNEVLARSRTQIRRHRFQERLRASYEENISLALTDSLTGLNNRRYLGAHLDSLVARARRDDKEVGILMIDIDFFKTINDSYGHAVGDEVLRVVASRISRNLRGVDTVARWGGEEFVVVMPRANLREAAGVAERLRRRISVDPISVSAEVGELKVTVSIGVALSSAEHSSTDEVLKLADEAMYDANRQGRDRVAVAPQSEQADPGHVPDDALTAPVLRQAAY